MLLIAIMGLYKFTNYPQKQMAIFLTVMLRRQKEESSYLQ